jgi:hypothetical protein
MYGSTATDSLIFYAISPFPTMPADSMAGAEYAVPNDAARREESFFVALVISNGPARLLARFCEPAPTYAFRLNR